MFTEKPTVQYSDKARLYLYELCRFISSCHDIDSSIRSKIEKLIRNNYHQYSIEQREDLRDWYTMICNKDLHNNA